MKRNRDAVNTAVVGYGLAGRCFHAPLIRQVPALKMYAVVARRPEVRAEAQERERCRGFAALEDALADDAVDLIVLPTPSDQHADQAVAALSAGKHVVVDKPMATTRADAERMLAAAKQSGKMLSVFHNRRWDGDFLVASDIVRRGVLGRLQLIEATWQRPVRAKGWRGTVEQGGGRLNDLGSHLIDQALVMMGRMPETVYARIDGDAGTVEDIAMVTLGFAGGVTCVIDTNSPVRLPAKPRWHLMGTAGNAVQYGEDPQEAALRAGDLSPPSVSPECFFRLRTDEAAEQIVPLTPGRWQSYYENVADAILNGASPAVTAESAAEVISVIDAARRSAETGDVVRWSRDAGT